MKEDDGGKLGISAACETIPNVVCPSTAPSLSAGVGVGMGGRDNNSLYKFSLKPIGNSGV